MIGCFSWPSADRAFWLAKPFWYGSLWLSIFALVSSAQEALLEQIPERILDLSLPDGEVSALLRIALRPAPVSDSSEEAVLVVDVRLLWLWQTPVLLMSLSWVTFCVGYALYIMTPLIDGGSGGWTVERTVSLLLLYPKYSTQTLT